jgi:hypothetical protein
MINTDRYFYKSKIITIADVELQAIERPGRVSEDCPINDQEGRANYRLGEPGRLTLPEVFEASGREEHGQGGARGQRRGLQEDMCLP